MIKHAFQWSIVHQRLLVKYDNIQAITYPREQNITLDGCENALGNALPPYYIFQGKRWYPYYVSLFEMTDYSWLNSVVFKKHLQDYFSKYGNTGSAGGKPVLALFDTHVYIFKITALQVNVSTLFIIVIFLYRD